MADPALVPVDSDPFGAPAPAATPQLVPVDHDPFAASPAPESIRPQTGFGPLDAFNNFSEQMQRAALMGFGAKLNGLIEGTNLEGAKGINAIARGFGANEPFPSADGRSFSDAYAHGLQQDRDAGNAYAAGHPIASKVASTLGTIGAFGPGSGGAAASLGGRVLQGIKGGAAVGALSGFGNSNDQSLAQTAADTGVGAATGAAVGGALPVVANVVSPAVQWAARQIFGGAADSQAVQRVAQAMQQDEAAGGPSVAQIEAKLQNATQPLSIRDIAGENVAALGGQVARTPGPGRQAVTDFLEARDVGAGPRIMSGPLSQISQGGDAYTATKALIAQRAADSAPAYEAAFSQSKPVEVQPIIDDLDQQTGQAKGGIRTALQKAQSYLLDAAGNPDTTLSGLHQSKLAIDDLINGASDSPVGRNAQRLLVGVKGQLLDAMDAASTDANGNSLYAQARNLYAGPSQLMDAMELGQGFNKLHPNAINDQLGQMSDGEKQAFLLGVKDNLTKAVLQKGDAGNEALAVAKNGWARQQLQSLFANPADYDNFIGQIENEGTMFKTMRQDIGGSDTARRVAQDGGGSAGSVIGPAAQTIAAASEGAPVSTALGAMRTVAALAKSGNLPPSSDVAAKIAPILYNADPAANQLSLARVLAAQSQPPRLPLVTTPLAAALAQQYPSLPRVPYLNSSAGQ